MYTRLPISRRDPRAAKAGGERRAREARHPRDATNNRNKVSNCRQLVTSCFGLVGPHRCSVYSSRNVPTVARRANARHFARLSRARVASGHGRRTSRPPCVGPGSTVSRLADLEKRRVAGKEFHGAKSALGH